jgi:hypothetical protein
MPARKRASHGEDAQSLPLREKRRRTQESTNNEDLEDSLSHIEEPIAKRALRSNPAADVPLRLNNSGSPEVAKAGLAVAPSKKSHVKFGSESPPPAPSVEESKKVEEEEHEEDEDEDSDDEAPEAISHSHAAAETKAAQAEEARRLKQQEQEDREKRRRRDTQLKAQVKTSEKRQRKADDQDAASSKNKRSKYDLDNLPNLLPEELLATEAPERSPTPPPAFGKPMKLNGPGKARVKEDRGPVDVVHKGTKIRVLQKNNSVLPPKAKGESRSVRDQWLKGRAAFQQVGKRGTNVATVRRRAGPTAFA